MELCDEAIRRVILEWRQKEESGRWRPAEGDELRPYLRSGFAAVELDFAAALTSIFASPLSCLMHA